MAFTLRPLLLLPTLLSLLSPTLAGPAAGPPYPPQCFVDSQESSNAIAQRWLNSFATGGLSGLPDAVTDDIHIYDAGATNGSYTTPYVTSLSTLNATIALGPYGGNGVTNVTYDVVFTFYTCTRIALRWQQNVITTPDIGYGSEVPAGQRVSFQGTDLLTIGEGGKVGNVTTSADLLGYYRSLGYDLGVWTVEGEGMGEGATTGAGL